MAIRPAANSLFDGVSLVNCKDTIFALELGHAFDLGFDRLHDVLVCPHPSLLDPLILGLGLGLGLSLGLLLSLCLLSSSPHIFGLILFGLGSFRILNRFPYVRLLGSLIVFLIKHLLAHSHLVVKCLLLLEELLLLRHAIVDRLLPHHSPHISHGWLLHAHERSVHSAHSLELLIVVSHHLLLLLY